MADHILNDCPNCDIECEYSSVGCDIKRPQQQLAVHMREAASVHLLLFKRVMNIMNIEHDILNYEIEWLTHLRIVHVGHRNKTNYMYKVSYLL